MIFHINPVRIRLAVVATVFACLSVAGLSASSAADTPSNVGGGPLGIDQSGDINATESSLLPGDLDLWNAFHRERQNLTDAGIIFKLQEQSEIWAKLAGHSKQNLSYNGLTTGELDLDLEKLVGWTGATFTVEAFDIHGHGPSRSLVGNQQLVSNIEATPSVKLYDLWLEQHLFGDKLSVRLGQEGANDEMMTTTYAGMFLNSSFGFPGMPAADLPSGGPNYPMATPFARAQYKAADNIAFVAAVFNGDPAPAGIGDPQIRDRNGTAFRLNDHTLGFGEIWYLPDPRASESLPTTYKIGGWYSSSNFADQRFAANGALLANPANSVVAQLHSGDWAFYGIVDQQIWLRPGTKDQGIGVFLQVMGGPSDRNLSNFFIEGGMNWRAPFADRADDVFGFAVSYLGISPAARAFSRDLVSFGGRAAPYASNETVLELTYQAPVTNWLTLQPDAQYVINPNVGLPGNFGNRSLSDTLVIGMRATFRF